MDFAKKILSKYGWKDGDGLGKNNDGIAKPLKATLKFDNAGFGSDQAAADFNNHWWERVFNEAAGNVDIKHNDGEIKMRLKDDKDGVEISTKGYSLKKLKKAKQIRKVEKGYDNFLQAATLTVQGDEIENPNKIDADDIEVTKVKVLTDEELFKACGGRTAHKGARHGLKQSGKLSRIEQQEEKLLAKMMEKRNVLENGTSLKKTHKEENIDHIEKERVDMIIKKKHRKKEKYLEESNKPQTECTKLKKEKKKRKKCREEGNLDGLEIQMVQSKKKKIEESQTERAKLKKKHKSKKKDIE